MITAAAGAALSGPAAWDAWAYFLLHLLAAVVHATACLLLASEAGAKAGLQKFTRALGVQVHGGQLALHLILGTVAFFNWRLRGLDGSIPWWLMITVAAIALGYPLYLRGCHRDLTASRRTEG